jgi:hypothetical protein
MKAQGLDVTWFENVRAGTQDPFVKMHENDINKHMTRITVPSA